MQGNSVMEDYRPDIDHANTYARAEFRRSQPPFLAMREQAMCVPRTAAQGHA